MTNTGNAGQGRSLDPVWNLPARWEDRILILSRNQVS